MKLSTDYEATLSARRKTEQAQRCRGLASDLPDREAAAILGEYANQLEHEAVRLLHIGCKATQAG